MCYVLARHETEPIRAFSRWRLNQSLGPSVATLTGWRCRICGYQETTPQDVERCLARREVRRLAIDAVKENRLSGVVEQVISAQQLISDAARGMTMQMISDSKIAIRDREGWMRPCPQCGSEDTGASYWIADEQAGNFELLR